MSEVIDFKGNILIKDETPDQAELIALFTQLISQAENIKDILFFVKDVEDSFSMFYSNLNIQERSFLLQMLQHDIFQELTETEELILDSEN